MRRLILWVIFTTLVFAILIGAIRVVVGDQGDTLARSILGSDSAAQPQTCWHGVCPGQIPFTQSAAKLAALAQAEGGTYLDKPSIPEGGYDMKYGGCVAYLRPSWQSCVSLSNANHVDTRLHVRLMDTDLRVGDVVALLGSPKSIDLCGGLPIEEIHPPKLDGLSVQLLYANGLTVYAYAVVNADMYYLGFKPLPATVWRITPEMHVFTIDYDTATEYSGEADGETSFLWRGFGNGPNAQNSCGP